MAAPASFMAADLINDALAEIGAKGEADTVSPESQALGFTRLNSMIDRWGTQRLTIYQVVRTVFPLVSGTQTYTIGAGGTFNVVRPLWIPYAGLVLTSVTPNVENPIHVLTDQDWSNQGIKTLGSAYPSELYYDYNWAAGLAQITLWPVPTGSLSLALYLPTALTQYADLSKTSYSFPPGYYEAQMYNLALRLWTPFNNAAPVPQDLRGNANQALGDIKRANIRLSTMPSDPALFQGSRRGVRRSSFLSGNF